ncbi:hypothetical protein [Bradyrhizobium lablabi]|uniref:hypothetical protein n=1 Tax=Bradyrhizobium lablabi TaxID=722472 RepID=UPI002012FF8E|nr:hypothetical protein [Bradyrhizobium lablabi]
MANSTAAEPRRSRLKRRNNFRVMAAEPADDGIEKPRNSDERRANPYRKQIVEVFRAINAR